MASSIGVRFYLFEINKKGNAKRLKFSDSQIVNHPSDIIDKVVKFNRRATQNSTLERSWYFQQKETDGSGCSRGYIRYGTFGFESDLVDAKTQTKHYRRKKTDVEEIPLFYEFWIPDPSGSYGFMAFQSFQGRSCITLVASKLKEEFEKNNDGYMMSMKKILPSDGKDGMLSKSQVKRVKLIRRNLSSDVADRYIGNNEGDSVDFEITIAARPRRTLGNLGGLVKNLKGSQGFLIYDGISFPEAIAEVKVGQKLRKVGIIGGASDAGVIDITNSITRGPDGHPTFASLKREIDSILSDIYDTMPGTA